MKKIVTTLFFLAILTTFSAYAQERASDKNLAKWSFGFKGGINYFRVEPYAIAKDNFWAPFWKSYALQASWTVPMVFVEYTANHWFGVGLELGWLHYNRSLAVSNPVKGSRDIIAPAGMYWGNTADAVLYGSINLTNLIAPYRKGGWRAISLYANGGLGGAWYRYKTPVTDDKFSNHAAFLGMASLTTAFNVSKVWELFIEGQYRSYTKEDLGGFSAPGHSVDAIQFLVGVRWKLGAKASKEHTRNELLQNDNSELLAAANAAKKAAEEANDATKKLEGRVKALEDAKPGVTKDDLDDAVKNLQRQIDDLRNGQATSGTTSFKDIRFKTASHELTAESTRILDEVANVLNNDAWTTLEVFGYTDNVGGERYNQILSENRARTVKEYLVKKGIDAAKIRTIGKGIRGYENSIDGRAENRRVDFRVSK